jgi:hypothetical protein
MMKSAKDRVKRTFAGRGAMSACDPSRSLPVRHENGRVGWSTDAEVVRMGVRSAPKKGLPEISADFQYWIPPREGHGARDKIKGPEPKETLNARASNPRLW